MKLSKFLIPAVLLGFALAGTAHAQSTNPNYWKTNVPSSTISPINPSLKVPCANIAGGCVTGTATTSINGVFGPTFTVSIVATTSASSVTTSTAQILLNLLSLASSSDITISNTGTIIFASHNISQFTNNAGYGTSNVSTSTANTWSMLQTYMNGLIATSTATSSYVAYLNGAFYLPAPSQFASGVTCGSATVTNAGDCINDLLSFTSSTASATLIYAQYPGTYSYPNLIADATLGQRLILMCVGGSGTVFNYTGTSTALNLNAGAAGLNGYNTHLAAYGTFFCSFSGPNANGTTTGLLFGGSHGAEGATFYGGTISGFGTDLTYASGSWKTTVALGNIMNAQTLWKWPGGLTDSGEGNIIEDTNFHDNTATSSISNFVNCVISQGGGYFDFEDDQWDDCQLVNAGTGFMKIVNPHFENAAADTASSSYTFVVNSNGSNANSVMSIVNPSFVQDASNTAPTYFIQNSSTIYVTNTDILNNGPAQVVNTFIQNNGAGTYSVCNIGNQNNAFKFFFNGNDNNPVFSGGQLLGCSQAITGNWPTGWFSIGNNIYATEDGGLLQAEISTVGLGEGTTTVSATHSSAITGSNNYGSITTTGNLSTTTVTFNGTWNFKPACGAGIASGTPLAIAAFGNTTSVVITAVSAMPTGTIVNYWCYGNPN